MVSGSIKNEDSLKIKPTEDGLQLGNSILWFDSTKNGQLTFLSSAERSTGQNGPQVIATEETIRILEANRKKPKALVCQYNRPVTLGKLKMELLPSGSSLGGASLHVETNNHKILYAPRLQTQKISTVRQMQLKKAEKLILGAYQPDLSLSLPSRKKEKERLLATVQNLLKTGVYPTIVCQPSSTAQELTKLLSDNEIPIAVHPAIHRINKVYESFGSQLGHYSLFSSKHTRKKVKLFPTPENGRRKFIADDKILIVEDFAGESADKNMDSIISERFTISSTCEGKELKEVIQSVMPKEVYIYGPYAKRYVTELKKYADVVSPLYPNSQPSLF